MSTDERILVMGVGNPLMKDEGVGPRVVEILMGAFTFPGNVEVVDCGTMGYTILDVIRDADHLIIIDAFNGDLEPGAIVRLEPDDFAPNQVMHSLHDMRLVDVLQAAELVGIKPETECIGVQVRDIAPEEFSIGLTDELEAAVPRAVAAVLMLLEERGATPSELADADDDAVAFRSMVNEAWSEMRDRREATGSSADYSG